ncbi:MAG: hypothetical protein OEM02_09435 [Desulfobulbaceae bacterium]|nr:hypothetical protein [Desulfobulbaceae bacterium]
MKAFSDLRIHFTLSEERNEDRGLKLGAVYYITKPFSPELVKSRVRNQLELKRYKDHLEELVALQTKQLLNELIITTLFLVFDTVQYYGEIT